jgi:hypothetical protein
VFPVGARFQMPVLARYYSSNTQTILEGIEFINIAIFELIIKSFIMKTKIYLLVIGYLISISSIAQKNNNVKENKWQVGVYASLPDKMTPIGISSSIDYTILGKGTRKNKSFCIGLSANYFIKENNAVRIKAGITDYRFTENADVTVGVNREINYVNYHQEIIHISPGIFWNLNQNIINIYGGIELPVLIYCPLKYEGYGTSYILGNVDADISSTAKSQGGFAIGPGIFSGLNIKLFGRFLVGGEFSFDLLYYRVGGHRYQTVNDKTHNTITNNEGYQAIQTYAYPRLLGQINIYYSF